MIDKMEFLCDSHFWSWALVGPSDAELNVMSNSNKAKYQAPKIVKVGDFGSKTQHSGSGKRFDISFIGTAGEPVTDIFS